MKVIKRIISYLLVAVMLVGLYPGYGCIREVKAATASVALANLGSLGSMTAGSKTKSGNWWMMKVGGKKAFCMNLGYTCHTGDVYQNSSATYNSGDSGKKGKKAYIGYWYAETMKESRKAYVMAQALFWAVEEGDTSETKLKAVIRSIKSNTGYFDSKSVNALYSDIFEKSGSFSVKTIEWKYSGSGSHRQELLVIDAGTLVEPQSVTLNDYYRQGIRIHKTDEDGKPMAGVKFTVETDNIDELYYCKVNGTRTDADEDVSNFTIQAETDASGWISLRLSYRLQTDDYFYLSDNELKDMDSAAKRKLKEEWDDMGYRYASDLTREGAYTLIERDLHRQMEKIKNTYTITETDPGNKNNVINPEYKNGKKIVLEQEQSWTRFIQIGNLLDWDQVVEVPYEIQIKDNYKKAALSIKKNDSYSRDQKTHGDASLDGAEYGVYIDRQCTKPAPFYQKDGSINTTNIFEIKDGLAETGYLRCGETYYIKEVRAPEGYLKNEEVKEIRLDGTKYPDIEYVPTKETVEVGEIPILGKIALQKFYSDGKTGEIHPEVGAVFQVYLESNGSYDACDEYERDILTIDETGYACSKELYYGEYRIHQVSSGDKDTEKIEDKKNVLINNPEKVETKTFNMNNNLFKAYLRIIKKDGNTEKDVLKPGTSYQIYSVDASGNETLVKQTKRTGNKRETVDTFITDMTGQIETLEALTSGRYRIYERDTAAGLHISVPYIEVDINSQADNYTEETDEIGNTYSVITLDYVNQEAYGKLSLKKTGEKLTGYKDGQFVWEERQLKGVIFEIYASENIETQDGQGTNWFEKDDLVATITTGEGAEFTKDCKDITGYTVDEDGMVTVSLPLGKYHVKEKQALYGYVLPDKGWDVEFNWDNKDDEYVLNATEATDEAGRLNVKNQKAGTQIRLVKSDAKTKTGIAGAVFGIYTKNDIYAADGEKIVEAGSQLGTMTTDGEGNAVCSTDLPLMSEGYIRPEESGSASGGAVSGAVRPDAENGSLNSGDYYLKEQEVSGSYYLDDTTEYPVHLEYEDQETKVVTAEVEAVNTPTNAVISKTSVTDSEELAGCGLQITDTEGNVIVNWISGDKDSIKLNENLEEMGYRNVTAVPDEKGAVQINGMFHDTAYTLTETRPADGFVTADSISFQLVQGEDGQTLAALVKGENRTLQTDNIVHMVDDTTKVEISKTDMAGSEEIPGCELEVKDKDSGDVIDTWMSTEEKHRIEQKFIVGRTYILTEKRPADGYVTAESVDFTVRDTGEIQGVHMKDDTTKVRFEKKDEAGKRIAGATVKVYDSKGKKTAEFTTGKGKAVQLEGILKAGETYTFKETKVPEGYERAEPVRYTVRDTGEEQTVTMVDKKIGTIRTKTPDDFDGGGSRSRTSPQTGYMVLLAGLFSMIIAGGGGSIAAWRRYLYGKN